MKNALNDREEITNNVVGQVYVENVAMKLFDFADNEDRNGRFHMLVCVLCTVSMSQLSLYVCSLLWIDSITPCSLL